MSKPFRVDAIGLADLHLSNALPHAKPLPGGSGLTTRFSEQIEAIGRAATEAARLDVPILALGDMYDRAALDAITLTESIRLMTKSNARWIVIAGNHDAHSLSGGRFNVEVFREMEHPRIELLKLGQCVEIGEWDLHALPFASVEMNRAQLPALRAAAEERRSRTGRRQALLMHQAIVGCRVEGKWISDHGLSPDEACQGFDETLAGHFHEPQRFGRSGRYLGAPMQFRTSDAGGERGAWLLSFTTDKLIAKRLDLGAPRFFRVGSIAEAEEQGAKVGDYVFVETSSISSERDEVSVSTETQKDGLHVVHKHTPVYHHTTRAMEGGLDGFRRSPLELSMLYLSHETVQTGGFSFDELAAEARAILDSADKQTELGSGQADIVSMTLRDVLIFKSAKVAFAEQGLTFVQGKNEDTAGAFSNGAGKTSIYKALGWVLYGQTIDDEDVDGFIRRGEDTSGVAFGSVTFRSFGERWTVQRERSKGRGKVRLLDSNGQDVIGKRRDVQEQINTLIGFDFEVWRNVVIHDGEDPEAFSAPKCRDSDRRSLLHKILGTGHFAACHEAAKARASTHNEIRREIEGRMRVTQALIKDADPASARKRVADWNAAQKTKIAALEKAAREAADAVSKFKPVAARVPDLAPLVRAEEQARREAARLEKAAPTKKAIEDLEKVHATAQRARAMADANVNRHVDEIQRLEEEACPTCGAPINDTSEAKALLATHRESHARATEEAATARARVIEIADQIKSAKALRAELDTASKQLYTASQAVSNARRQIAEAETQDERNASKLEGLRSKAEAASDAVSSARSEVNPYLDLVAEAELKCADLEGRLEAERAELAAVVHAAAVTDFWVLGFSPQGLPAMLLDVAMPVLTEQANAYLRILADGDIAGCITTQGETKAGDTREKITMRWTIEGAEGVTPSKGQRTKIRVAVDLALVDLAAARGMSSNLLLFDEVLDGLDPVGTEKMLELLYKLRAGKSSIFVISHNAGMAEDFERGLLVTKSGGSSSISLVS